MLLTREKKEQLVAEMTEKFGVSKTALLINFQGLKVKEVQELKKDLSKQGIEFQIIKNTLLKIALKNSGLQIDEKLLDQPIAIVWGQDEVMPAKITNEFAKKVGKLDFVGGFFNKNFTDVSIIKKLAVLPSQKELYAKLVGTLNAPMYRLVNALQGNLRSLVYILSQYQISKI